MANSLNFNSIATVLNQVVSQATGKTNIGAINTSNFVTVAQKALLSGYDNYINAVSQVLSQSIFSSRPYEAVLDILSRDSRRWGNHVRKITALDMDAVDSERLPLRDGTSVDPWTVNKRKVVQFNFYGQEDFTRFETIFTNQMDVSLSGPEEFARFLAMIQNAGKSQKNQDLENLRRQTLANFIAGLVLLENAGMSTETIVHLLTEYNTFTGNNYSVTDIHKPANYDAFIRWASARITTARRNLRERGYLHHANPGVDIPRHTPNDRQQFILFADEYDRIRNSTFATTFNEGQINGYGGFEAVNFFQSPKDGDRNKIITTPSYIDANGDAAVGSSTTVENIFGIVYDDDAMGETIVNERSYSTPVNPRGEYSNIYWHYTGRFYNDFTENAILFLLD